MNKKFLLIASAMVVLSLISAGIGNARTVTITPRDTQSISDVQNTAPAETTPVEVAPSETAMPETIPSETTPAETVPPETTPPETTSPVTMPPETTPPETTPPVTAPPDTTPPETTPPETTPPVTMSPETTPPETAPPAVTSAAENSTVTYILNKNSKKFHYPDCASVRQMKEKNRLPFNGTRDEVISQGYTPCKNCDP